MEIETATIAPTEKELVEERATACVLLAAISALLFAYAGFSVGRHFSPRVAWSVLESALTVVALAAAGWTLAALWRAAQDFGE